MSDALHSLYDLRLIELPLFASDSGDLVVMEGGAEVPMDIARVFTIKARDGVRRGRHAHKRCAQMVSCLNGAVDVTCEDGVDKRTFRLDRADRGLYIPPSIWVDICCVAPDTVLAVLCDRPYEENDYIRDYSAFLSYRDSST